MREYIRPCDVKKEFRDDDDEVRMSVGDKHDMEQQFGDAE